MATMLPGVRPNISLASLPTASTSPEFLLMATMEGSFTTMPLPLAYTSVFAVPRSMARSLENMLISERRLWMREFSDLRPFDDIRFFLFLFEFPASRRSSPQATAVLLLNPPRPLPHSLCLGIYYFELKACREQ